MITLEYCSIANISLLKNFAAKNKRKKKYALYDLVKRVIDNPSFT